MIAYFADRKFKILGLAGTDLAADGWIIVDDLKMEDVDTGAVSLELTVAYNDATQLEIQTAMNVGNYILKDGNECYTITEYEQDSLNKSIRVYAEDVGLDLLGVIAPAYEAVAAHTAEWYVDYFLVGTGFEVGTCDVETTLTLTWDKPMTCAERIVSIAEYFGAEISYSFVISGMTLMHKFVNIYSKRGSKKYVSLRVGQHIGRIVTTKTLANLCTALVATGAKPQGEDDNVTLAGVTYDDGDFYLTEDGTLASRTALEEWGRYVTLGEEKTELTGHIVGSVSCDAKTQADLLDYAIAELNTLKEPQVNYDIEIVKLPDGVEIGDEVYIVDESGGLYLTTRVLKLKTSASAGTCKATLGDFMIADIGLPDLRRQIDSLVLYQNSAKADSSRGTIIEVEGGTIEVASKTLTQLCSVVLSPGAWIIQGSVLIEVQTLGSQVSIAVSPTSAETVCYSVTSESTSLEVNTSVKVSSNTTFNLTIIVDASSIVHSSKINAVQVG